MSKKSDQPGKSARMAPTPFRSAALKFNQLMTLVAGLPKEMTMQQLMVLSVIYARPGTTARDLEEDTGLAQSSVNRNIMALSKWDRHKQPGHDLIDQVEDPIERRRKIFFLNQKGRRFMARMAAVIENVEPREIEIDQPTAQDFLDNAMRAAGSRDRT